MTDTQDRFWMTYLQCGEMIPEELVKRCEALAEQERELDALQRSIESQMEELAEFAAKELGPEHGEGVRRSLEETHRELAARRATNDAELQELEEKAQTIISGPDKPA